MTLIKLQKQRMMQVAMKRMDESSRNSLNPTIPIDGLHRYSAKKKSKHSGDPNSSGESSLSSASSSSN